MRETIARTVCCVCVLAMWERYPPKVSIFVDTSWFEGGYGEPVR
jgi:hypothetical protein